ncbi:MAG: winged helix-turn-helix transcriptional regulator [Thaumarchaeota archaeon]|nr:winged helix-turn-helix transcriptional regulator [Nitrososphaerota archaeon]
MKPVRAKLMLMMEILVALRDGPVIKNHLALVCNINFGRIGELLDQLERKGLIVRKTVKDSPDQYSLTEAGMKVSMSYQWINSLVMGDDDNSVKR